MSRELAQLLRSHSVTHAQDGDAIKEVFRLADPDSLLNEKAFSEVIGKFAFSLGFSPDSNLYAPAIISELRKYYGSNIVRGYSGVKIPEDNLRYMKRFSDDFYALLNDFEKKFNGESE
jgi:hypothetical protein